MNQAVLDDGQHDEQTLLHDALYASFGKRILASLIDGLAFLPLIYLSDYNYEVWKLFSLEILITFLIPITYRIIMEWKYGATLGKMFMKLQVVDYQLNPISFVQSIKRYSIYFMIAIFSLLSVLAIFRHPEFYEVSGEAMEFLFETEEYWICLIVMLLLELLTVGFVLITKKKQTLHDLIAKTYCVNKNDWLNLQQIDEVLNKE